MDDKTIKEKLSVGSKWLRLLFMVLFGIIGWVLEGIICLIAVFQFIYTLFTDKPLDTIHTFSASLSTYVYQIVQFLTYVSEEKPFPFSSWPTAVHTATKPRKKSSRTIDHTPESKK